MRGFYIKWYNGEGNFDGVAIVIAAAAIVIVAGCWEHGEEDVWCVEPFSSVIATCIPQSNQVEGPGGRVSGLYDKTLPTGYMPRPSKLTSIVMLCQNTKEVLRMCE